MDRVCRAPSLRVCACLCWGVCVPVPGVGLVCQVPAARTPGGQGLPPGHSESKTSCWKEPHSIYTHIRIHVYVYIYTHTYPKGFPFWLARGEQNQTPDAIYFCMSTVFPGCADLWGQPCVYMCISIHRNRCSPLHIYPAVSGKMGLQQPCPMQTAAESTLPARSGSTAASPVQQTHKRH